MKNRILYVDYMKAVAMILVIMGHVNFANASVKAWIYSFHMPAFFFCTGLVLSVGGAFSLRDTCKSKILRLMLPYLLWGLIYAQFSITNLLKICYGSYWSIANSGSSSNLWFLPVMFVALTLFYIYTKTGLARRLLYNVLVMIFSFFIGYCLPAFKYGYPLGVDVAFMAFAFMMFGYILKSIVGKFYLEFKPNRKKGISISLIFVLTFFAGTYIYHLNDSDGIVMMKDAHYGNCSYFVLAAIFGTLMLLFLSIFLEYLNVTGYRWLSFVGQNTLCIFVVHKPIISSFKVIFQFVPISDNIVVLVITTIATLLLSCLLCMLINKYAPILAGR